MSIKYIIQSIKDELGSYQVFVDFRISDDGVKIIARNYADELMAKRELSKRNIPILM